MGSLSDWSNGMMRSLGSMRPWGLMIYGVTQGSVLGHLLFLIYINGLLNCSQRTVFILFADDTQIFASGRTYAGNIDRANEFLGAEFYLFG